MARHAYSHREEIFIGSLYGFAGGWHGAWDGTHHAGVGRDPAEARATGGDPGKA